MARNRTIIHSEAVTDEENLANVAIELAKTLGGDDGTKAQLLLSQCKSLQDREAVMGVYSAAMYDLIEAMIQDRVYIIASR